MADRITEKDLILPALWCISNAENNTLSTTELQKMLREIMQPSGEDLEILSGRNDDKFSQKVRNLRSHQTLEKPGFATYKRRGKNGYWTITEEGQNFLAENDLDFLDHVLDSGFDYDDVKEAIENVKAQRRKEPRKQKVLLFDENAVVSEGKKSRVQQKVYVRSAKLRDAAIQHYTKDGVIVCRACEFNFEGAYGELGEGFIEIHHVKPVYAYDESETEKTIEEALKNVIPLCSNCHRMVHRRRDKILEVDELVEIIKAAKNRKPGS